MEVEEALAVKSEVGATEKAGSEFNFDLDMVGVAAESVEGTGDPAAGIPSLASRQRVLADVEDVLQKHGGPVQYLMSLDDVKSFGEWLWMQFPEDDQVLYQHSASFPKVSEGDLSTTQPLVVHVAALGFEATCSLKPPPGALQAKDLVDQYFLEGFCTTSSEAGPLLVLEHHYAGDVPELWQDGVSDNQLVPFSLAYLKGMARASSLLFLLHRLYVSKIDVSEEMSLLHKSVCKIHVHCVKVMSRLEEALSNMRISCRGSLRKSTNTVQAVCMIQTLRGMGVCGHMTFVRKWNAMAATQFQFTGKRLTALKLLFEEAPKDIHWERNHVLNHFLIIEIQYVNISFFHLTNHFEVPFLTLNWSQLGSKKGTSKRCPLSRSLIIACRRKLWPTSLHMSPALDGMDVAGLMTTWHQRNFIQSFSFLRRAGSGCHG